MASAPSATYTPGIGLGALSILFWASQLLEEVLVCLPFGKADSRLEEEKLHPASRRAISM